MSAGSARSTISSPLPDYHLAPVRRTEPREGAILLDCNEPGWSTHPSIREEIANALTRTHRYPDAGVHELVDQLAAHLRVDREELAVGAGSAQVYHQLVTALCAPGDEVVLGELEFEAIPMLADAARAKPVTVPLGPDHRYDLAAVLAAITDRTRIIALANPHNPTGTALNTTELTAFLDQVPEDVLVVLDEAYHDFVTDSAVPDGIELFRQRPNVAALRTFSKAHALAGLRVGYLVADRAIAGAARRFTIPYAVNQLAQAAATTALTPSVFAWTRRQCRALIAERDRAHRSLVELGYPVPESQANFLWLPSPIDADEFGRHCRDPHGLQVRVLNSGTAHAGVRVTVSNRDHMDRLLAAAAGFTP